MRPRIPIIKQYDSDSVHFCRNLTTFAQSNKTPLSKTWRARYPQFKTENYVIKYHRGKVSSHFHDVAFASLQPQYVHRIKSNKPSSSINPEAQSKDPESHAKEENVENTLNITKKKQFNKINKSTNPKQQLMLKLLLFKRIKNKKAAIMQLISDSPVSARHWNRPNQAPLSSHGRKSLDLTVQQGTRTPHHTCEREWEI